jgi:hypothetical protein
MAVTVKCQYTGFEFEAQRKTAKNHPVVSAFLAKYNDDWKKWGGAGDQLKAALEDAYGAFATAEETVEAAEKTYLAWRSGNRGLRAERKDWMNQRREVARARRAQGQVGADLFDIFDTGASVVEPELNIDAM